MEQQNQPQQQQTRKRNLSDQFNQSQKELEELENNIKQKIMQEIEKHQTIPSSEKKKLEKNNNNEQKQQTSENFQTRKRNSSDQFNQNLEEITNIENALKDKIMEEIKQIEDVQQKQKSPNNKDLPFKQQVQQFKQNLLDQQKQGVNPQNKNNNKNSQVKRQYSPEVGNKDLFEKYSNNVIKNLEKMLGDEEKEEKIQPQKQEPQRQSNLDRFQDLLKNSGDKNTMNRKFSPQTSNAEKEQKIAERMTKNMLDMIEQEGKKEIEQKKQQTKKQQSNLDKFNAMLQQQQNTKKNVRTISPGGMDFSDSDPMKMVQQIELLMQQEKQQQQEQKK